MIILVGNNRSCFVRNTIKQRCQLDHPDSGLRNAAERVDERIDGHKQVHRRDENWTDAVKRRLREAGGACVRTDRSSNLCALRSVVQGNHGRLHSSVPTKLAFALANPLKSLNRLPTKVRQRLPSTGRVQSHSCFARHR